MTDNILKRFIEGFKEEHFVRVGSKNMTFSSEKMMKVDIAMNTGVCSLL